MPRLRTSNIHKSNKRKLLYSKKDCKKGAIPKENRTYADYADDQALLANTPTETSSKLDILGHTAGVISILRGKPQKLVD